jgi:hypothetical protein
VRKRVLGVLGSAVGRSHTALSRGARPGSTPCAAAFAVTSH